MSHNNFNNLCSQELVLQVENFETLKQLVLNGADINYQYYNGWCLLFELVILGLEEELSYFAKRGLNLEVRDEKGRTALFWAIYHENIEMVALLLKLGISANERIILTLPALHYSVYKNHKKIVNLLLDHSADIEMADINKKTSLDYAYLYKNEEMVKLLKNRVKK